MTRAFVASFLPFLPYSSLWGLSAQKAALSEFVSNEHDTGLSGWGGGEGLQLQKMMQASKLHLSQQWKHSEATNNPH